MKTGLRVPLLFAAVSLSAAALSYPTDFIVIPDARVLPEGTAQLQLQYHGIQVFEGREYENRVGIQAGLGNGWEAGYDHRIGPPDARGLSNRYYFWDMQYHANRVGWDRDWLNVKKQVFTETHSRPAVALGIVNIGAIVAEGRYISVEKRFGDFDVLLGWSDVLDDEYVYEGLGYTINSRWDFRMEHVGRGRWSTNAALEGRIRPDLSVTVGYMRANMSIYPDSWLLGVTYDFDIGDL